MLEKDDYSKDIAEKILYDIECLNLENIMKI